MSVLLASFKGILSFKVTHKKMSVEQNISLGFEIGKPVATFKHDSFNFHQNINQNIKPQSIYQSINHKRNKIYEYISKNMRPYLQPIRNIIYLDIFSVKGLKSMFT